MMTWRRRGRLLFLAVVGFCPNFLKLALYRWIFGYRVGSGVRIGLSILDAEVVELGNGVRIGHFNLITRVGRFSAAERVTVGTLNLIRGGVSVEMGAYSRVMRLNVLNAIPDHDCTTNPDSSLVIGAGAVITSGHRIDFTDRVRLGLNVIVGGRNSSLWTHNRQETAPIEVGDFCYLGSEVRLAPGAKLAAECVLGIGAVLTREIAKPRSLVAGVPAAIVRELHDADLARIRRPTSTEIPAGFYEELERSR
jgi:carbonic anhydrase/acetyltransferase-like protein (isoleucine patch superfamily)